MRGLKIAGVAAVAAVLNLTPHSVRADELQDLKTQLLRLSDRIQQLEQQQKDQKAAAAEQQRTVEQVKATAIQAKTTAEAAKVATSTTTSPPATLASGAPVTGGTFPNSFLVPGTSTSMRIGGFIKLDAIWDVDAPQGDFSAVASLPLDGTPGSTRRGDWRLQARQTRLNVETRTPTDYGTLKTFVEGDFFGGGGGVASSTNGYNFEIRHAYAELGPFLAGQFWTTFMDIDALPEHEDNSGPTGRSFLRQGQLRYTMPLSKTDTLAFAIENPEGDFFGSDHETAGTPSTNTLNPIPDFVVRWRRDDSWGHVQLSAMGREIQYNDGLPHHDSSVMGYGLGLAGIINTWGKDRISFQINGGEGIGRYIQDANNNTIFVTKHSNLVAGAALGAQAAYQHWFTDTVRTNLIWATTHFDTVPGITPATANADLYQQYVNLYWSPVPTVNIGLEYNRGERHTVGGLEGTANRFQAGFQYTF
ncbi:MAG TPA: DcaP family trimeric outer membrane transporter [Aliidongia sp.]|nr:DcaP family trimeric outer membrane transporter [Aliidongia sp.]